MVPLEQLEDGLFLCRVEADVLVGRPAQKDVEPFGGRVGAGRESLGESEGR